MNTCDKISTNLYNMNYEDFWGTGKNPIKRRGAYAKSFGRRAQFTADDLMRMAKRPQRTSYANDCGYCACVRGFHRFFVGIKRLRLKKMSIRVGLFAI